MTNARIETDTDEPTATQIQMGRSKSQNSGRSRALLRINTIGRRTRNHK